MSWQGCFAAAHVAVIGGIHIDTLAMVCQPEQVRTYAHLIKSAIRLLPVSMCCIAFSGSFFSCTLFKADSCIFAHVSEQVPLEQRHVR
jgi:hypothetical protein